MRSWFSYEASWRQRPSPGHHTPLPLRMERRFGKRKGMVEREGQLKWSTGRLHKLKLIFKTACRTPKQPIVPIPTRPCPGKLFTSLRDECSNLAVHLHYFSFVLFLSSCAGAWIQWAPSHDVWGRLNIMARLLHSKKFWFLFIMIFPVGTKTSALSK